MTTATSTTITGYNENGPIINHNGVEITCDEQAQFSNRVFDGGFQGAAEGEEYVSEWEAAGRDADGNRYTVRWRFLQVRGAEDEADMLPWDEADRITVYNR